MPTCGIPDVRTSLPGMKRYPSLDILTRIVPATTPRPPAPGPTSMRRSPQLACPPTCFPFPHFLVSASEPIQCAPHLPFQLRNIFLRSANSCTRRPSHSGFLLAFASIPSKYQGGAPSSVHKYQACFPSLSSSFPLPLPTPRLCFPPLFAWPSSAPPASSPATAQILTDDISITMC